MTASSAKKGESGLFLTRLIGHLIGLAALVTLKL
jgi:hypothetical protein